MEIPSDCKPCVEGGYCPGELECGCRQALAARRLYENSVLLLKSLDTGGGTTRITVFKHRSVGPTDTGIQWSSTSDGKQWMD